MNNELVLVLQATRLSTCPWYAIAVCRSTGRTAAAAVSRSCQTKTRTAVPGTAVASVLEQNAEVLDHLVPGYILLVLVKRRTAAVLQQVRNATQ